MFLGLVGILESRDDVVVKDHVVNEECRETLDKVIKIFNYLENYYKSNYDTFRAKTYMSVNKALKGLSKDSELDASHLEICERYRSRDN